MDEDHLIAAFRYVSLNPVRARLVSRAEDWPWSSVRAHVAGRDDGVTRVKPVLDRVTDFAGLVAHDGDRRSRQAEQAIRASERTGRPLGNAEFVADLERILKRPIARRAPGRRPDTSTAGQPSLFA